MPKVIGRVLASKVVDGAMLMKAQLNGKLPRQGENILVKWGSQRSPSQNAFLWVYYTWLIEHGGLKDHGFFCPEALHTSLKAHFLSEKILSKGEWQAIEEGSTSTLTKSEFSEYMSTIDNFINDFFKIDTSPFFEEYEQSWKMR